MSQTFTEQNGAGAFIVSEANGSRSRGVVVMAGTAAIPANSVIHIPADGSEAVRFDGIDTDTNGTADAPANGILIYGVAEGAGSHREAAVIVRDAEINVEEVSWLAALDDTAKALGVSGLKEVGIISLDAT